MCQSQSVWPQGTSRQASQLRGTKSTFSRTSCLQSSCYFLFHNVSPQATAVMTMIYHLLILRAWWITMRILRVFQMSTLNKLNELQTGQSNNEVWRQLKRDKLTASNFHDAAVRQKEPDKFLRNIGRFPFTKTFRKFRWETINGEECSILTQVPIHSQVPSPGYVVSR